MSTLQEPILALSQGKGKRKRKEEREATPMSPANRSAPRREKKQYTELEQVYDIEPYLVAMSDTKARQMMLMGVFVSRAEMELTTRQYYARVGSLKKLGLIKKGRVEGRDGKVLYAYHRTEFGEVFVKLLRIAQYVINQSWRLKTIDLLDVNAKQSKDGLTKRQIRQAKKSLLQEPRLRQILHLIDDATSQQSHENKWEVI